MNRQDVFNRVATHLLHQNAQALVNEKCAYRGDNGMKCAIGVLIKDECYRPYIEGEGVFNSKVQSALNASGIEAKTFEDKMFLSRLQGIHDKCPTQEWKTELRAFAYYKNLDDSVLGED